MTHPASFMSSFHDNLLRSAAVATAGATAEIWVVAPGFASVLLLLEQATNARQVDANSTTCVRAMAGPYAN